ncbi:hypothetical protein AX774_g5778, partial [Zancudomyces culisetae]
MGRPVRV